MLVAWLFFPHSALPRALEVIIDVCKDLSKEGQSRSGEQCGRHTGNQGSAWLLSAPGRNRQHLGLIIYSQATKVPSSVDLIRRRFLTFAIGVPYSELSGNSLLPFWVGLKDHGRFYCEVSVLPCEV